MQGLTLFLLTVPVVQVLTLFLLTVLVVQGLTLIFTDCTGSRVCRFCLSRAHILAVPDLWDALDA